MTRRLVVTVALVTLLCACGKYGKPVRAGSQSAGAAAAAEVCEDEKTAAEAGERP